MGIVERIIAMIAEEANAELTEFISTEFDKIDLRFQSIQDQLIRSEKTMGFLADKIKTLTAVETAEGAVLIQANADLKAALEAAKGRIAELELLAATVPGLQQQLTGLQSDLASAEEAADAIANINPTPVSDGVIEEVIENPEVPTPPVVEEAPIPTDETIPATPVVEAAIDALDGADISPQFE